MEHLWAPWRLSYVTGASGNSIGCIFCERSSGRVPANGDPAAPSHEDLIVARGTHAYVVLNRYPYNNGHLMVVTDRHVANLAAAAPEELSDVMRLTRLAEMALTEAYSPQGLNIGINLGRPAGAGVIDHLHVHLVPRWNGDTSFISVVGNVRILPEELDASARRLRPIFERLAARER
jgi:ATP adenylyltransferase